MMHRSDDVSTTQLLSLKLCAATCWTMELMWQVLMCRLGDEFPIMHRSDSVSTTQLLSLNLCSFGSLVHGARQWSCRTRSSITFFLNQGPRASLLFRYNRCRL